MESPSLKTETYATCLSCINGKAILPAVHWIQENCKVDYVDMITEPGMAKLISDPQVDLHDLMEKINISTVNNLSGHIVIVAHEGCMINDVGPETQKDHVDMAVTRIKKVYTEFDVIGLWVNKNQQVETV